MKRSRRLQGWLGIAAYLAAVVLCPAVHLSRHASAAAGHTHDGSAPVELAEAAPDLVALGLEDAGAPAVIDCSLAALTLADCETPSHGTRRFGDQAPDSNEPRSPQLDPRHGAGTLQHLGVSILATRTFVLPQPRFAETRLALFIRPSRRSLAPALTHDSRGPPAAL